MAFGSLAISASAQTTDQSATQEFEKPDVKGLQRQIDDLKARVDGINAEDGSDASQQSGQQTDEISGNDLILEWTPGPRISSKDDLFQFQINGRITYDYSIVSFKDGDGAERPEDKINGTNLRHLELGVRGRAFGVFNYRMAAKFVDNEVEVKLAYVDYTVGNTTFVVGQTRTYNTLDKLTPPPNTAFAERAAFINAMRINPRVGVGVSHHGDNWSLSGGYFFENVATGNASIDDNNMASARATFSPRFENGVGVHFGFSGFYRNENGNSFDLNYSARPFVKQGDLKPLASQEFNIKSEMFYNAEFVTTYQSFAVQAEYGIVKNKLSALEILTAQDPAYQGGYVEISFFPTGGERTIDGTDGRFNKVDIRNPVGKGGMGEVRLAARYDIADFTHEIFGRKQKSIIVAADWYLNDSMKIQGNYGHTVVKNAMNVKTDIIDSFNLRFLFGF